jgi:hypothetical protein
MANKTALAPKPFPQHGLLEVGTATINYSATPTSDSGTIIFFGGLGGLGCPELFVLHPRHSEGDTIYHHIRALIL